MDAGLTWLPVRSSTVAAYAYDPAAQRLYIRFHSGDAGYYANVPEDVFAAFQVAASKGSFVAGRLRGNPRYPWTPLAQGVRWGRTPRFSDSDDTRYRYRCSFCGAIRTLSGSDPPLPKHKRKGEGARRFAFDCPGSGGYGVNLGLAPPRRAH
jgi:hypothetical protein